MPKQSTPKATASVRWPISTGAEWKISDQSGHRQRSCVILAQIWCSCQCEQAVHPINGPFPPSDRRRIARRRLRPL